MNWFKALLLAPIIAFGQLVPGNPSAFQPVAIDTLSDTSLISVQIPGYLGGQSVKMRRLTLSQLANYIGSDTGSGSLNRLFDSLTALRYLGLNMVGVGTLYMKAPDGNTAGLNCDSSQLVIKGVSTGSSSMLATDGSTLTSLLGTTAVQYSTDDAASFAVSKADFTAATGVFYSGSLFFVPGLAGELWTSATALPGSWTSRTSGTAERLNAAVYTGAQNVVGGANGTIITSPTGATWTGQTFGVATQVRWLTFGEGVLVACGESGMIRTSDEDGVTWTARTSNVANTLFGCAYGNSMFVAVGNNGNITTSADGTTWTSRTSGVATTIYSVVWNGTRWVAVGASGVILTSEDGVTWVSRSSGTSGNILSVVLQGSDLYAAGVNYLATSTDGITWQETGSALFTCINSDSVVSTYLAKDVPKTINGAVSITESLNRISMVDPACGDSLSGAEICVQEAIDRVCESGGSVFIPGGNYLMSGYAAVDSCSPVTLNVDAGALFTADDVDSNFTPFDLGRNFPTATADSLPMKKVFLVLANSPGSKIIGGRYDGSGFVHKTGQDATGVMAYQCDNCVIDGVDSRNYNPYYPEQTYDYGGFTDGVIPIRYQAITLFDSEEAVAKNSYTENAKYDCIGARYNPRNNSILNNEAHNCWEGVQSADYGQVGAHGYGTYISGNKTGGYRGQGIVTHSNRAVIENNPNVGPYNADSSMLVTDITGIFCLENTDCTIQGNGLFDAAPANGRGYIAFYRGGSPVLGVRATVLGNYLFKSTVDTTFGLTEIDGYDSVFASGNRFVGFSRPIKNRVSLPSGWQIGVNPGYDTTVNLKVQYPSRSRGLTQFLGRASQGDTVIIGDGAGSYYAMANVGDGNSLIIGTRTLNGADNQIVVVSGGGDIDNGRGSRTRWSGNEDETPGTILHTLGNVSTATYSVRYGASQTVGFQITHTGQVILTRQTASNADATIAVATVTMAQTGTMSADRTWTLPTAALYGSGRPPLCVVDESGTAGAVASQIIITRSGADLINGVTTAPIITPYGVRCLISDGVSKWTITNSL
jgi:hypothetical protein